MPIYEYVCPECKLKFEQMRPLSQADEDSPCPQCHKPAKRVFSRFASFSRGDDGSTTPLSGGSPCSTCGSTDCSTCGL